MVVYTMPDVVIPPSPDSFAKIAIFRLTSKNLCLAKDKAKAEQEELDIHDTA